MNFKPKSLTGVLSWMMIASLTLLTTDAAWSEAPRKPQAKKTQVKKAQSKKSQVRKARTVATKPVTKRPVVRKAATTPDSTPAPRSRRRSSSTPASQSLDGADKPECTGEREPLSGLSLCASGPGSDALDVRPRTTPSDHAASLDEPCCARSARTARQVTGKQPCSGRPGQYPGLDRQSLSGLPPASGREPDTASRPGHTVDNPCFPDSPAHVSRLDQPATGNATGCATRAVDCSRLPSSTTGAAGAGVGYQSLSADAARKRAGGQASRAGTGCASSSDRETRRGRGQPACHSAFPGSCADGWRPGTGERSGRYLG